MLSTIFSTLLSRILSILYVNNINFLDKIVDKIVYEIVENIGDKSVGKIIDKNVGKIIDKNVDKFWQSKNLYLFFISQNLSKETEADTCCIISRSYKVL